MTDQEFLEKSRELTDSIRKGYRLCAEIQSELNEDVRKGRISYEEWTKKTDEIRMRMSFFEEQMDHFDNDLKRMKKH